MSAEKQAREPVVTKEPCNLEPPTLLRPVANKNLPVSNRGALGSIAAASSNFVVTSIGGMFNRMSEYFEMRTISESSTSFTESDDFENFYDSVEDTGRGRSGHGDVNGQHSHRGILSGISSYFPAWRKYQPVPTQDTFNNNSRRNSSSVDGDQSQTSLYSSFSEEDTSFCEPYPLINESINGEGVYVDDEKVGQGHKFVPTQLLNIITWCDKCGELIWGFYKQCLRCTYCKYTCHYKCGNDVGLDCTESPAFREESPEPSPQHTLVSVEDGEDDLDGFLWLTREELEPKINKFNAQRTESLTLNEEGTTFSGRVTIHINLSRPVSVRTGCPLPDICISTLKQYEHSIDTNKRRTTFFLPKATPQDLNITCYTTAQDVIRNLLAQLQLIDNPRKFALFERTEDNGEVFMRKMVDEDKPLCMCLGWVSATGTKRFELRENETGVIEWEAFTIPELQNFLRILDKEEEEYVQQVRRKYVKYQALLQEAVESAKVPAAPMMMPLLTPIGEPISA